MRLFIFFLASAAFVSFGASAGHAQKGAPPRPGLDQKFDGVNFAFGFLELTHGVKLKSAKRDGDKFVTLLEFTRDLDGQELKNVRSALRETKDKSSGTDIVFYFFDVENVVLAKQPVAKIQGEITGKMGDAFRVFIEDAAKETVRKIEPRQVDPEGTFEPRGRDGKK